MFDVTILATRQDVIFCSQYWELWKENGDEKTVASVKMYEVRYTLDMDFPKKVTENEAV